MANVWIAALVATLLSLHGLRKKSLSPSGAAAAFIVGFGCLSGATNVFGVALIVFYLTGSRATKYGKQRKAKYEDGYHEAGYRTGWQVLSNSATALVACTLWNAFSAPDSPHSLAFGPAVAPFNQHSKSYDTDEWCPLDSGLGWSRALVVAAVGHFACCLGDTLASELGILSSSPPVLITTLKSVPRGTNGGVSLGGTLASLFGGVIIGLSVASTLLLESRSCRERMISVVLELVLWGGLCGGVGSLIDSILGATIQETKYSTERKKILTDEVEAKNGEKGVLHQGLNVLSNNQVNVVSSLIISISAAFLSQ